MCQLKGGAGTKRAAPSFSPKTPSPKQFCTTPTSFPETKQNEKEEDVQEIEIIQDHTSKVFAFVDAARKGELCKVKEFIENGLDINDKTVVGVSALHYAAFYNHYNIVQFLVENGATIDVKNHAGNTPLYWAVDRGFIDIVGYLLECEADPAIPDFSGLNTLHVAVRNKNFEMVETLFSINTETEKWTKVNSRTSQGLTPCYYAAGDGTIEMLKLLVANGADINIASNEGQSPLFRAVFKNRPEIIEYLLSVNANINHVNNSGRSALHIAASLGYEEVVSILLNRGARLDLVDTFGQTASQLATRRKFDKITAMIKMHEKK